MSRAAAAAVSMLCGVVAALLYLAPVLGSAGALFLVYLTQLPLFIAGLWLGTGAAAIAGVIATLLMLAAADGMAALLFSALNAAPVILLVRQALLARPRPDGGTEWYPGGSLTAWLTAYGLAGLAAGVILLGGPQGIETELGEVIGRVLGASGDVTAADRSSLAGLLSLVMPGLIVSSWMAAVAANAALGQGLLARFGANWRPSPDLAGLVLPLWIPGLAVAAVAAIAVGGLARFAGINVAIALSVPLCLAGLAVLHAAARRLKHPMGVLIAFYAIAGLFGWPLMLAALLGLCEPLLGLRRRLAAPGP
ncbi:MAG: DUF2232 domain-containing protein [Alphaproteobacteria bacterium]|nr:DUF2232 domain-containing protein [Alphaproteobacteria bacterium]